MAGLRDGGSASVGVGALATSPLFVLQNETLRIPPAAAAAMSYYSKRQIKERLPICFFIVASRVAMHVLNAWVQLSGLRQESSRVKKKM
jgi:hypothetical protein